MLRFFDLPRDLVFTTASEWLDPAALFKYLTAMRVDNSLKALLYLTEIFQALSTSKSKISAECQRLFAVFFSNLPPVIQSGFTITTVVESNLYECMQTEYSSPQHRAQILYFLNTVKSQPIVVDKDFSNFLGLHAVLEKEASVEESVFANESLESIINQLDVQAEITVLEKTLKSIQNRIPEMTKDFVNNAALIEKLTVIFYTFIGDILMLAVDIFFELTPLFFNENLIKFFCGLSEKFVDLGHNKIEWYEPLTAIAENLSMADAENLFKHFLQKLNAIEVVNHGDEIMRSRHLLILFVLMPYVSTTTVNISRLQNDWLPLLTQVHNYDCLELALAGVRATHCHFIQEEVESQELFSKLLNIFNHENENININFNHRKAALAELICLVEDFYASKKSVELEGFLKKILKLFTELKSEIKLGLKALLMLIPVLDAELLLNVVKEHDLLVILIKLFDGHGHDVRLRALKALQLLAYNDVDMDMKTIMRIALRFVDKREGSENRDIALDILTLLMVKGTDLSFLQSIKAHRKKSSDPFSWIILEGIQDAYDKAQNVRIQPKI